MNEERDGNRRGRKRGEIKRRWRKIGEGGKEEREREKEET